MCPACQRSKWAVERPSLEEHCISSGSELYGFAKEWIKYSWWSVHEKCRSVTGRIWILHRLEREQKCRPGCSLACESSLSYRRIHAGFLSPVEMPHVIWDWTTRRICSIRWGHARVACGGIGWCGVWANRVVSSSSPVRIHALTWLVAESEVANIFLIFRCWVGSGKWANENYFLE